MFIILLPYTLFNPFIIFFFQSNTKLLFWIHILHLVNNFHLFNFKTQIKTMSIIIKLIHTSPIHFVNNVFINQTTNNYSFPKSHSYALLLILKAKKDILLYVWSKMFTLFFPQSVLTSPLIVCYSYGCRRDAGSYYRFPSTFVCLLCLYHISILRNEHPCQGTTAGDEAWGGAENQRKLFLHTLSHLEEFNFPHEIILAP